MSGIAHLTWACFNEVDPACNMEDQPLESFWKSIKPKPKSEASTSAKRSLLGSYGDNFSSFDKDSIILPNSKLCSWFHSNFTPVFNKVLIYVVVIELSGL